MQQTLHALAYTIAGYFLLTWFGNVLCRQIFSLTGLKDATASDAAPAHNAGRWIGTLERIILAIGVILQRWEILAAVVALKTVSRFKELDRRDFAEYFLVGSLFSILWAMLVAGAWQSYDHSVGIDLRHRATVLLGMDEIQQKT
ncbi:hypothetical protein [Sphingomonas sp. PAMC 26605]|uniref:hypothetical protein n=1 Tax=Sphingomonas sp. PAMC 26605 TaxID=1112214 RepID=UPI00026CDCE1|nr:hypothetical protein [Sphingomonas sp. PAMC 26605]